MKHQKILLSHGGGGRHMRELIQKVFLPQFKNPILEVMGDSAWVEIDSRRWAFTTDSFVVKPLFFPGGDIGKLAICGTVNDLAVAGAKPMFIAVSFIMEEGLSIDVLQRVTASMAEAAQEAGVEIIAGDTKVVEKGACDELFITTSGLGVVIDRRSTCFDSTGGRRPSFGACLSDVRPGDRIIVSGFVGDHGIAVISQREGLKFETQVPSDCAPLGGLVEAMLGKGFRVRWMRDPTRGGLATTLSELAEWSGLAVVVDESQIPVREEVRSACEILGFDPLYVASEGKLVAVVEETDAEGLLQEMRRHKYGRNAAIIGKIAEKPEGKALLKTSVGGMRLLTMLAGEQLPRIC